MHNLLETETELIPNSKIHSHFTHGNSNLHLLRIKTEWGKQRFDAAKDWNDFNGMKLKTQRTLKLLRRNYVPNDF